MIAKITRGAKMSGLLTYLQGEGKANEHTDPHLVAGDPAIMAWHDDNELSRVDALDIAKQLDQPRRVFGTEVMIPNYLRDSDGHEMFDSHGKKVRDPIDPFRDGNVWHCSLSLKASEGELTDEVWGKIAHDFMDHMGFTEESGRSPARWVAVRHGLSANGNDHIHIAASVVREDGTKVNLYRDYARASEAVNAAERKYGLEVIESRENGTGDRAYHRAEHQRAQRVGHSELDRTVLARRVRACASASKSEAEFVRRLRGQGLIVRPRMASGRDDVVVGYKVALRPESDAGGRDAKPVFYGGGHLAKDLTLPRLRKEWEDSPTVATDAVDEWRSARRDRPAVRPGRETQTLDPKLVERAATDIASWNKYLASIPVSDRAQWARAAGRSAGVFSAWSVKTERTPGPLAAAAAELARSAQVPAHKHWPKQAGALSAGGAALILMQTSSHLGAPASYALLLRQLMKTVEAIASAHRAAGDAARARELETMARTQLDAVHRQLPVSREDPAQPARDGGVAVLERPVERDTNAPRAEEGVRDAATESARRDVSDFPMHARDAVRRGTSPVPGKLEPRRDQAGIRKGRDDGPER
ncbi:relaxase/mobilization nuclease domain-containing protein (plasmid) [Prescottella equi]|uniref:Relaxase/mobilization nuclease domain-containing protein n=1 Tax=Rhodococcus hoagii TaxID=43767 RepID=A0A9Q2URW1_RHOHA|nr:relaxase/mobilization nuclease domain-containing protein [Prescottella equi]AVR64960.1 Rlaxase MobP [Prescottella equi]MBM4479793.1 relaxase/mobilization nuclease domain-containing protein [Prescottella equi]MBM4487741.1 relaxase/mobilization nuclease domain-containing protein [Prescottella equi]MBM4487771.1 relaxase/mobilization nuclease domain-containing protein [Prescottella equi]MBM4495148.1 relaxase/mobilization nuclease domain-containing protein [Prescottella equi]